MAAEEKPKGWMGGDVSPLLLAAGIGAVGTWLWWNRRPLPTSNTMSGRVCVVTGANAGIGKATATALAQKGAHVVLACRSPIKCADACKEIRRKVPGAAVEALPLDLSSVESIRGFVELFRKTRLPLHVLVNNAGIIPGEPGLVRGMEKSMVVNHLGPFLLTHLLLPDLRKGTTTAAAAAASTSASAGDRHGGRGKSSWNNNRTDSASRIVNVGSRLEKRGSLWAAVGSGVGTAAAAVPLGTRWFEPPPGKNHDAFQLYGSSKLCNQLFTFELDRRLKATQKPTLSAGATAPGGREREVIANIVTPGVVNTGLGDSMTSPWVAWVAAPLKAAFMRTVGKGAETVVWAATSPEIEAIGGGKFFGDMKEVPCSDASRDEDLARQLWKASEVASGLDESERIL
ncbi:unnamed protein product [Pylaiella littoralis]